MSAADAEEPVERGSPRERLSAQRARLLAAARKSYKKAEWAKAADHYGRVRPQLEDVAERVDVLVEYGTVLLKLDRTAEAAEQFASAATLRPGSAAIRSKLAKTLSRLKRHEEASDQFRAALDLAPGDPELSIRLAGELRWLSRPDEARVLLGQVLSRFPENVEARLTLAALEQSSKKFEQPGAAMASESVADLGSAAPHPIQGEDEPCRSLRWLLALAVALTLAAAWLRSLLPF